MVKYTYKEEKRLGRYSFLNIVIYKGKKPTGHGFITIGTREIGLEKCPACERENYNLNVMTGQCTWCPWNVSQLENK